MAESAPPPSALVLGGGFAGIAASVALAGLGVRVTLLERRTMLGGRASSFVDAVTGLTQDACQHCTLGCCTHLAALLEKLGVHQHVKCQDTIAFRDALGRRWDLRGTRAPAPFHAARSFVAMPYLGLTEKAATARALLSLLVRPATESDYEATLGAWLRRHGTPERAIEAFIGPVVASACNETVDDVALGFAHKVLRDGFLAARTAFHLGIADRPMGDLLTEPVGAFLAARGSALVAGCTVRQMCRGSGVGWRAEAVDGRCFEAGRLILAVPFDQAARICAGLGESGRSLAATWEGLHWSPITGVHLWYDRPVECPPALALPGSASQWLFSKPPSFGRMPDEAGYLTAAISADRCMAALPGSDIAALVAEDARQALPSIRDARLCRRRVVKERKATFAAMPGAEQLRPRQRTPIPGLYLAGDWTRTGWPSTMEGATRSGNVAASELLADLGLRRPAMPPDLAADWPAQALMGVGKLLAAVAYLGSGSRST